MLDVFASLPKGYFLCQKGYFQKVYVVQLVLELKYCHQQELKSKRMMVHGLIEDRLPQLQEFVLLVVTKVQVVCNRLYHRYLTFLFFFANSFINNFICGRSRFLLSEILGVKCFFD